MYFRSKSKLAITVSLSGWIFSATYIFVEYILLKNYTISHFFLPEDTPHLILHLMVVFAPFVSTSMGYLVNQRTSLLKSLKKSEERYRDLYQNAPDGYHSTGPDGTILEVNDTWLKMLGHERNEVIGRLKITDILNDNSFKTFEKNYPVFKQKGSDEWRETFDSMPYGVMLLDSEFNIARTNLNSYTIFSSHYKEFHP